MACATPLFGFRTGSLTENGKECYFITSEPCEMVACRLVEKFGYHIGVGAPVKVVSGTPYLVDPIPINCGHCFACRMAKAKEWTIRCLMEKETVDTCWFLTLTYSDSCRPESLVKKDLQLFIKRLRRYSGVQFRYFACGEYGEKSGFCHFHILIFGNPFFDATVFSVNRFKSKLLDKTWKFGLTDLCIAEDKLVGYCCQYQQKKQLDPNWDSYKVKPFIVMSRKPAIGWASFEPDPTFKVYGSFINGSTAPIPRTFIRKLGESEYAQRFKDFAKKSGIRSDDLLYAVYATDDIRVRAQRMQDSYKEKISNIRRNKI